MWIRDYLPRDAPNARILTYGYPATLQGNTSISTLQDYTATFVQSLIGMRDSAEVISASFDQKRDILTTFQCESR
jgi:hypothetical protein